MANEDTDAQQGMMSPRRTRMLMVLVVVITAIAIWLVPVEEEQPPPSLPAPVAAPEKVEKLPLPAAGSAQPAQPDAAPSGDITALINDGGSAREYLAGLRSGGDEPDAALVLAEAQRRDDQGRLEDAYLMYRYAARHGEAQAALILGTQADPAFHAEAGGYLPEADVVQAYKWYSMAAEAGEEEAVQRLAMLHERLEQEAAQGDAQARRLLLQWR